MKKYPELDTISAWYELGMQDDKTISIRIHQKAWGLVQSKVRKDAPVVLGFMKHFPDKQDFKSFEEPNDERPWGFGNSLVPARSEEKDWRTMLCSLPVMFENKHISSNVWALRATLSILFTALWLCEEETKVKRPQLMVIEGLRVDSEIYGGGLSATLTPTVARWLAKQEDNSTLVEVEKAMFSAELHMWRNDGYVPKLYDFRAVCRQPKWINLTVPGNACGLDPDDYFDGSSDHGYRLVPHNTDNGVQQLVLLVGLAKLQDLVRKDPV